MSERPDPVLLRLGRWVQEEGLSREAVAQLLGVKRPTVAGWLLGLEAAQRGEPAPKSAREFRFITQRPEVQQRIADVLQRAPKELRAESLGTPVADPSAEGAAPVSMDSGIWNVAQTLIGGLARQGLTAATGTAGWAAAAHRIAAVAATVPEVAATSVVAVYRGRTRTVPWQYQVVVHASVAPEGISTSDHVADVRHKVDRALTDAGLTAAWEHGSQRPDAQIMVRDGQLPSVGSLISPVITSSKPPHRGLLAPSADGATTGDMRVGVVLSGDYGGGAPLGGGLAMVLAAGFLRSKEVVRAVRLAQAERGAGDDRGALLTQGAAQDAGFILHVVQHLLERGDLPGAWLLSVEAEQVAYTPLLEALSRMPSLVVVVHMDEWWRRLAAWRLAAAKLNDERAESGSTSHEAPPSSDWILLEDGREVPETERATLRRQAEQAATQLVTVQEGERRLLDLAAERKSAGRPTITVNLARPQGLREFSWSGSHYRALPASEGAPADEVVFCDDVDAMVDAWADAAAAVLDHIAALTGHQSGGDLIDLTTDDLVTEAYRLRMGGLA